MSFAGVIQGIQGLSKSEKIKLIQFLAQEIQGDDVLIEADQVYALPSPDQAFSAAAALLQALEEDKARS